MARKANNAPARKRRGNVTSVDFGGVESGGGSVPDGRYVAKLLEITEKEGQESGEPYLEATWEVTSRKCQGRKIKFDNYSLQPQALWRLKTMLEALGETVPDGAMDIDWDKIVKDEEELILEIVGKEGNGDDGRKYARVVGTYPLSDGNTVDDEDDEPRGGRRNRDDDRDDDRSARRDRPEHDDRRSNSRNDDDDAPRGGRRSSRDRDDDDRDDARDDDRRSNRRGSRDDDDDRDARAGRRGSNDDDDAPRGGRRSSGTKKLKRGARVEFKDEKKKLREGEVEEIDGDTVTVVVGDDTYEMSPDDLTVID